ncbi:MAG: hypothetical protein CMJ25_33025 [Phycisphaerae bacterium]|nr:hypothetical protein [Phycisphaerae bacterium]|tara:strand:+ start:1372 stop:2184 length:813 start_codon:yes stop_codon:yes gene_type:complete
MAKQATAKQVEVAPQVKAAPKAAAKPQWEYKDRTYFLITGKSPLIFTIPSKHSRNKPLLYFDKESGYQRELRYATNQKTPFADEQKGEATLGRIVMKNGTITVPKEQVALQKLLSLYHPLKDKVYKELNKEQDSVNQIDWIELELEALTAAKNLDVEHAEAILRSEFGEKVTQLSSNELKRDLMIFAKRNPVLFLELADDDHIQLRNTGAKAVEAGILSLSSDQRTFTYGTGGRKLMTIPFDEHPYSALAAYFKTDDGMEVYKAILKKLK